jgi:hypothetical protein
MARRILNRRELREESEAVERQEVGEGVEEAEVEEEAEEPKAPKKAPAKRKTRSKAGKEVRLKAFWGVFTQTLTQVSQYEYSERDEADKRAKELTESKKTPHFVQLVKKVIEE